jgi:hypothetical protein
MKLGESVSLATWQIRPVNIARRRNPKHYRQIVFFEPNDEDA